PPRQLLGTAHLSLPTSRDPQSAARSVSLPWASSASRRTLSLIELAGSPWDFQPQLPAHYRPPSESPPASPAESCSTASSRRGTCGNARPAPAAPQSRKTAALRLLAASPIRR